MINERNFMQILSDLAGGAVVDKCGRKLKMLAKLCELNHQSGEFILKLKLRPNKSSNMMAIVATVQTKEPAGEPIEHGLYVDVDGNLTRNDPTQFYMNGESRGNVQAIAMGQTAPKTVDLNNDIKE